MADVHSRIDGILGTRYTVPFANPLPAIVIDAAKIFACDAIYARRGKATKETNPWMERAANAYRTLEKIAKGELPLTPDKGRSNPSASVITDTAKTVITSGKAMA